MVSYDRMTKPILSLLALFSRCATFSSFSRQENCTFSSKQHFSPLLPNSQLTSVSCHFLQRFHLKEDSGQYYRDLNAAKYPSYPMAPVIHAIMEQEPRYPTAEINLFACGSTLGNLLRFARGADKAFRFNIEVIGSTVFFVRNENDPKELIEGVRGFGHTFPEAYTTWDDLKDSISHQRIIRYTFGGMQCLVRFESDGYIGDGSKRNAYTSTKRVHNEVDILDALQGISVTPSTGEANNAIAAATTTTTTLTVQKGGQPIVPHSAIFDLKTRSGRFKKEIDMSDIYPLLWLKLIDNHRFLICQCSYKILK